MVNKCIVCNTEFEALKSTKKYCSNECMNQARRDRARYKKENPLENIKEKKCILCDTIFTPKTPAASQRLCCYDCMPDGVQLTREMFLQKIKEKYGGACKKCGYNKCLKALEFHHIDTSKKDFTISNDHFKLVDAMEESKKCIMLCANCHRELHDNLWEIKINEEEKNIDINR